MSDLKKREGDKFSKAIRDIAMKTKIQIMECSAFENVHVDQVRLVIWHFMNEKCFEELAREIYTDVAFEAYEQEQANNLASKEEEE